MLLVTVIFATHSTAQSVKKLIECDYNDGKQSYERAVSIYKHTAPNHPYNSIQKTSI
jgi:hypothetical protein